MNARPPPLNTSRLPVRNASTSALAYRRRICQITSAQATATMTPIPKICAVLRNCAPRMSSRPDRIVPIWDGTPESNARTWARFSDGTVLKNVPYAPSPIPLSTTSCASRTATAVTKEKLMPNKINPIR